jgi:hypothetical protein
MTTLQSLAFAQCPYCLNKMFDIEDCGIFDSPPDDDGSFLEITCPYCDKTFYAECTQITLWTSFFKKGEWS